MAAHDEPQHKDTTVRIEDDGTLVITAKYETDDGTAFTAEYRVHKRLTPAQAEKIRERANQLLAQTDSALGQKAIDNLRMFWKLLNEKTDQ